MSYHAQTHTRTGIVVLAVAWPVAGLLAGVWIVLQVRQMIDTAFHWAVVWRHCFGRAYIIFQPNYFVSRISHPEILPCLYFPFAINT